MLNMNLTRARSAGRRTWTRVVDELVTGIDYLTASWAKAAAVFSVIGATVVIYPSKIAGVVEHRTPLVISLFLLLAADAWAWFTAPLDNSEALIEEHAKEAERWFGKWEEEAKRSDMLEELNDSLTASWIHLFEELGEERKRNGTTPEPKPAPGTVCDECGDPATDDEPLVDVVDPWGYFTIHTRHMDDKASPFSDAQIVTAKELEG